MVRGLYTAWTGMSAEQKRLDIITNNLANASTVGYKKDGISNQSFDEVLTLKIRDTSEGNHSRPIGNMSLGVKLGEAYTHYTQGPLRETGNALDLAIEGDGFFTIRTNGNDGAEGLRYTRDGTFTQTRDGNITDVYGNSLLGMGGEIVVPVETNDIAISNEGYVFADGQYIDQLQLAYFENSESLEKVGNSMYQTTGATIEGEGNSLIHQGFTEQSNVNVVSEMVNMIAITRAYEANQKVIQTIDRTLDSAANSIGRI